MRNVSVVIAYSLEENGLERSGMCKYLHVKRYTGPLKEVIISVLPP